jgi:hypothetical protein
MIKDERGIAVHKKWIKLCKWQRTKGIVMKFEIPKKIKTSRALLAGWVHVDFI